RRLPRPLAPSGTAALIEPVHAAACTATSPVLDRAGTEAFAMQRGTAIHRLLQMLPQIESSGRAVAARRYIERIGRDWPQGEGELACASVISILEDPTFSQVFA